MSVKERLKIFLRSKKISEKAFGELIGVSSGYVSAMRTSIQPDKLTRIAKCFPELNTDWLMTGEGEMLKTDTAKPSVSIEEEGVISIPRDAWEIIRNQSDSLKAKDEQLTMLTASLKAKDEQLTMLITQGNSGINETVQALKSAISTLEKELAKKGEDVGYPSHVVIRADTE